MSALLGSLWTNQFGNMETYDTKKDKKWAQKTAGFDTGSIHHFDGNTLVSTVDTLNSLYSAVFS